MIFLSGIFTKSKRGHLGDNIGDVNNGGADELRQSVVHLTSLTSRHDHVGCSISCRVHAPDHEELRAAEEYVRLVDHLLDSFPGYDERKRVNKR